MIFNSTYFIHSQEWKDIDGESVGDWIEFDDTLYSINWRTVYKNKCSVGTVVFCYGKGLIVRETKTGENCYYTNKSLFK